MFSDSQSAPEAPPLEEDTSVDAPPGDAVERESAPAEQVDRATADEVASAPEER